MFTTTSVIFKPIPRSLGCVAFSACEALWHRGIDVMVLSGCCREPLTAEREGVDTKSQIVNDSCN